MADVKISALPTASVVNNADIAVINQGGTTKTASKALIVAGLATTSQISGLATTAQLSAFQNSAQVQALASAQIAAITPASIGALSTAAASGFATTDQISGFTNTAQVSAIASAQIAAITPASIGAFATSAVIGISNGGTGEITSTAALSALGGMPLNQEAAGGDIGGLLTAPTVIGLQGKSISMASPNSGEVLRYQGQYWEPASISGAPLDSPAFTGTPTAPTAAAQTNTTQIATTAFVLSNSGDRYLTTSTTSNTITNGAKTFTVASGLSYTPTQDITIVYNAANHMHGSVTSYSGTTLVVDIVQHSQTSPGPYTQWTINVGGLTNTAGTLLSANNLSDVASTSTSLTNLGGVSTARTISAGTGLSGGGDLTANRTLSIAALSPDPTGIYGSTSQIPSLTVNNLGQVTAVSLLSFRAPQVQVFDAVGTFPYSKPEGARLIRVQLWSGGGGGASGRKGSDGTVRCAGGGGGSGGYYDSIFDASVVSSPVNVIVGGGGNGALAQIGSDQSGTNGSGGSASSFGTLVTLPGGNGGSGGTATAGFGGGGSIGGNTGSGASGTGAGGVQGLPGTLGATSTLASGSGASGGGLTTGNATAAGNTGGRFNFLALAGGSLGLAGATGATPTSGGNGGAGASMALIPSNGTPIGAGGGGGGGSANGAGVSGGNGGNGGFPAGGGGGGGAASNACVASGAGGAGGAGCAVITAYF